MPFSSLALVWVLISDSLISPAQEPAGRTRRGDMGTCQAVCREHPQPDCHFPGHPVGGAGTPLHPYKGAGASPSPVPAEWVPLQVP